MTVPDHALLFAQLPDACLVLTPDLVMSEANAAYLTMAGKTRDEVVGHRIEEVFPVNPEDPDAAERLFAGYRTVLRTRRVLHAGVVRYDFPVDGGAFEGRYWTLTVAPVLDADGEVAWLLHRAREVTATREHLVRALELSRAQRAELADPAELDELSEEVLDYATTSLETAELAAALSTQLGQLQQAMVSRSVIEQAKGILMAAHRVDAEAAFDLLTDRSQRTNTKLRTVAEEFVAEAVGPPLPAESSPR